jgi:hypothetical protein
LEIFINQIFEKWVELLEVKEEVTLRVFSKPMAITAWINPNSETLIMLKEMVILEVLSKKLFTIVEEVPPSLKSLSEILTITSNKLKISLPLKVCTQDNTCTVVKKLV